MVYTARQPGFTLIEVSIVLVIIGLLVGGVMVGKDLIHAAQIRSVVRQVEQFNTAANTFRVKYNCLPGDCANAGALGLDPSCDISQANCSNDGSGDALIGLDISGTCPGSSSNACEDTETTNFWFHLSMAGLIAEKSRSYYDLWYANGSDVIGLVAATKVGYATPSSKINALTLPYPSGGAGNAYNDLFPPRGGWSVVSHVRFDNTTAGGGMFNPHSFILGLPYTWGAGSAAYQGSLVGYVPNDMYSIDSKIDDGKPLTGTVRAISRIPADNVFNFTLTNNLRSSVRPASVPANAYCVDDTVSPALYNGNYPGNTNALSNPVGWRAAGNCSIAIKASF